MLFNRSTRALQRGSALSWQMSVLWLVHAYAVLLLLLAIFEQHLLWPRYPVALLLLCSSLGMLLLCHWLGSCVGIS